MLWYCCFTFALGLAGLPGFLLFILSLSLWLVWFDLILSLYLWILSFWWLCFTYVGIWFVVVVLCLWGAAFGVLFVPCNFGLLLLGLLLAASEFGVYTGVWFYVVVFDLDSYLRRFSCVACCLQFLVVFGFGLFACFRGVCVISGVNFLLWFLHLMHVCGFIFGFC